MTKIGLEIHCQLTKLNSKLFCSCKADYRNFEINKNICPTCVGIPGSLPRLNQVAVKKSAMIAMSLGCSIPERIAFFRKNYFYPDLPKNFQITQLNIYGDTCIGTRGKIVIDDIPIHITRVQIEEDPGRLIYDGQSNNKTVLVDYNRAGVPLVEIVTEPDFTNPKQVRTFINILADLLENLDVADPSLDGAMRVDANVSVEGGNKVEIKNIGSFHDLEKAIHYELTRQTALHSRGLDISQETRHWDDKRRVTSPSRSKEESLDYHYILEADVPWVNISSIHDELENNMPESINSKRDRYVTKYGIPHQVANVLAADRFYSNLFEATSPDSDAVEIANIITTDLMGLVDTRQRRNESKITAKHLKDLAGAIMSSTISRNAAKSVLQEMVKTGQSFSNIVSKLDLTSIVDQDELDRIVSQVISEEPDIVTQAKTNPKTTNYLLGLIMRKTKGKADPKITMKILRSKIDL